MKEKLLHEIKRQAFIFGAQEAREVHLNGIGQTGCKEDPVHALNFIYLRVVGKNEFGAIFDAFYEGKELAKKRLTGEGSTKSEVLEYLDTLKG